MTIESNPEPTRLTFRHVGGDNDGRVTQVPTPKCLLLSNGGPDESVACAIFRGPIRTALRVVKGEVKINGIFASDQWLNVGDQIQFADTQIQIQQLDQLVSTNRQHQAPGPASVRSAIAEGDRHEIPAGGTDSGPFIAPSRQQDSARQQDSGGDGPAIGESSITEQEQPNSERFKSFYERALATSSENAENRNCSEDEKSCINPHDEVARLMDRLRACGHWEDPLPDQTEDDTENAVPPTLSNETQLILLEKPEACENDSRQFPSAPDDSLDSQLQNRRSTDICAPLRSTDHADPSVQDYMNQLFDRLRGQSGQAPQPVVSRPIQRAKKQPEPEVEPEPKPVVKVLDPSEYVPKRVAPERNANIDAMRALANDSIRSALHISNQQRRRALGLFQIGSAIGGAVLGAGLFTFSSVIGDWYFYGGILSILVGGIAAYRFIVTKFSGSTP